MISDSSFRRDDVRFRTLTTKVDSRTYQDLKFLYRSFTQRSGATSKTQDLRRRGTEETENWRKKTTSTPRSRRRRTDDASIEGIFQVARLKFCDMHISNF